MHDPLKIQADDSFNLLDINQFTDIDQFHINYKQLLTYQRSLEEIIFLGIKLKKLSFHFKSLITVRVAVLSNSTTQIIENFLRTFLFTDKVHLEFYHCDFNQLHTDIFNPNSKLYTFKPDLVLMLIDEQSILESASEYSISQFKIAAQDFGSNLLNTIQHLITKTSALIILNSLIIPRSLGNSFIDYQSKQLLNYYFCELNYKIISFACESKQVIVLDTASYLQTKEVILRDERLANFASIRWDSSLLCQLAQEVARILFAKLGLNKKCLVVDLDNTLWGGIIGDEGVEGIRLGGSAEGEIFKKFQQTLKNLKNQGVLLAINSKNAIENVTELFKTHPHSVLNLNDFVAIKTNWQPKHENILAIAKELNIGLESLVFIDDNIAECTLVSGFLPLVETVHLPSEPSLYISTLLEKRFFNNLELTQEDKFRTQDYHANIERKLLLVQYDNYENYLSDLAISIKLFNPTIHELNRISQLTLRTNQFNLSNHRFTVLDLKNISNDAFIIGIESEDRFGSNGVIGAVIGCKNNDQLEIRNFVLSCRVFSRKIEHTIIRLILNYAKQTGFTSVHCRYVSTPKNQMVKDFLLAEQFISLNQTHDAEIFRHYLNDISPLPSWIKHNNFLG